jgi:acyl-CoA dehydrogenase
MIWAMHQVQMMCVEQHHGESSTLSEWLREASVNGCLVASVTSERGTGGDLRSSTAAMERAPEGKGLFTASKAAPTVSFGMQADAFLVTLRTSVEARPTDQVAVLVRREQVTLEPLNTWDPLGMRGTCSPGFQLSAVFDSKQILPDPFSKIAAHTMVPVSHLLWAAVWIGLAAEGLARATRCARRRYRHSSGLPTDRTLAEAHWRLAGARAQLVEFARLYAPVFDARHPATTSFAASANAIKIAASETSLSVAQLALRACGMAGYAERSEFSIARLLRDLHSAPLMIGNERLLATNAAFALTLKGYE